MKEKIKSVSLKRGDVLIIAVLLVICALWFILPPHGGSLTVTVIHGGEEVMTVDLGSLDGSREEEVGGCVLLFERDGVSFVSADCPNGLCVRQGKLTAAGESAACVPNGVVVILSGGRENADIVSY